jgi:hypothetical protein
MQKRWLKDFEWHLPENAAQKARDLAQSGQVRQLRELERHFWVAQVTDEKGAFETEMMITPNKIKAFYCECFTPGRKLMCVHVAAALIKLRQYLEQRAEEKKAAAAAEVQEAPGRMTIRQALEHASPEALKAFIQEYARKDRDFALALKTRFAADMVPDDNPFPLILHSVLPRKKQAIWKDADFRRFKKTLDDLQSQAAIALLEGNYRQPWLIAQSILAPLLPLLGRQESNRYPALLEYTRWTFNLLEKIHQAPVAPDLRHEITRLILEQGIQNLWPPEMLRQVIQWTADNLPTDWHSEIQERYSHSDMPPGVFHLHLFLLVLSRQGRPEATRRVLEDFEKEPARIREAVLELYYLKQTDTVVYLIDAFLQKGVFNTSQRRELEDLQYAIARQQGNLERQRQHLRGRFVQTGHFDYYQQLKISAGPDWPRELEEILTDLERKKDTGGIAAVLAAENRKDALADLLGQFDDLHTLQRFETLFLPENRNFVRDRYRSLIAAYLREHFGRPGALYAREHLQSLLNKGEISLVKEIIGGLVQDFSDRPSLPEELSEWYAVVNGQRKKIKIDIP